MLRIKFPDYPKFSILTKSIKRSCSLKFLHDGKTCSYLCLFAAPLWSQPNSCVMVQLYKAKDIGAKFEGSRLQRNSKTVESRYFSLQCHSETFSPIFYSALPERESNPFFVSDVIAYRHMRYWWFAGIIKLKRKINLVCSLVLSRSEKQDHRKTVFMNVHEK